MQDDVPTDMYDMISVNCKYKPRIRRLMKDFQTLEALCRNLASEHSGLKTQLQMVHEAKLKI
jgi:transcriptional antiterminator Rof (Rho-off)